MTLRAAVLGHPISHSKSPALHRAAYAHLGVELDYSAIDVTEDALPAFMAAGPGGRAAGGELARAVGHHAAEVRHGPRGG